MIIATVGHVDHGKTSLVRALTGIDTDRLPEEKRRGMTIEPGFAAMRTADGAWVDFVDLPGHERFARHMLSGITAVDAALVVIAADDGPMPQTHEHLAVLELLGLERAAVVISKIDRRDAESLPVLVAEVEALLARTSLRGAPILPISVSTGQGLEPLHALIADWQRQAVRIPETQRFRLAIDRCFHRPGAGRIVAGTVMAGTVSEGDLLTAGPSGASVRVRGLQVHGEAAAQARSGQRCALNIVGAGSDRELPDRGDWLMDPALHNPTTRIDAQLRVLASAPRAIGSGAVLQLHLGATLRNARVALLDAAQLAPGQSGLVQLLLDRPVCALWGERWVLRDAAAQTVVGGVRVLDPMAPARRRAQPARRHDLALLAADDPATALSGLAAAHPEGVEWTTFALSRDLPSRAWRAWPACRALIDIDHPRGQRLVLPQAWEALQARLLAALADIHGSHPDRVGMTEADLLAAAGGPVDLPVSRAALRALVAGGAIVRDGFLLRLPHHHARLAPDDEALLARVVPALLPAGLRPVPPGELAPQLGLDLQSLSGFLARAADLGHVVQIARNRFFPPATLMSLVDVARACAADAVDGRFDAKSFRDRSGLGRNLSIQVLEFFDRTGITRFAHERRTMVPDP